MTTCSAKEVTGCYFPRGAHLMNPNNCTCPCHRAKVGSKWNHPILKYLTVMSDTVGWDGGPITVDELESLGYEPVKEETATEETATVDDIKALGKQILAAVRARDPKAEGAALRHSFTHKVEHPSQFTAKANAGLIEQALQEAHSRLDKPHNPTERLVFRATIALLEVARQEAQECYAVTDPQGIPRNVAIATLNVLKTQGLLGYDP